MTDQEVTPTTRHHALAGLPLAAVALIWMAAMLWSARSTITGGADAEMEVTSTAYALPGAISASLVAGAAAGLAVLALLSGRRRFSATDEAQLSRRGTGASIRFAIATGTGLAIGLLGAATMVTINTDGWLYAVVGGTVAAAGTIGGALAGLREPRVVAAVCWAAIGVFVVGFVLSLFQDPVLHLLGSGRTDASRAHAARWFTFCQSVLSGLAAGLISYAVLRRARRRAGADLSWPRYALAGAGPGLLLVLGEGLTRTAGARVLDLAGKVSELELTVQRMLSGARFNSALIVLFVGAISAVIAVGRTMGPARPAGEAGDEDPAGDGPGAAQTSSSSSETAYHSSS